MLHASRISLSTVRKGRARRRKPTPCGRSTLPEHDCLVLLLVSMAVGRRLMNDAEWRQSVRAADAKAETRGLGPLSGSLVATRLATSRDQLVGGHSSSFHAIAACLRRVFAARRLLRPQQHARELGDVALCLGDKSSARQAHDMWGGQARLLAQGRHGGAEPFFQVVLWSQRDRHQLPCAWYTLQSVSGRRLLGDRTHGRLTSGDRSNVSKDIYSFRSKHFVIVPRRTGQSSLAF